MSGVDWLMIGLITCTRGTHLFSQFTHMSFQYHDVNSFISTFLKCKNHFILFHIFHKNWGFHELSDQFIFISFVWIQFNKTKFDTKYYSILLQQISTLCYACVSILIEAKFYIFQHHRNLINFTTRAQTQNKLFWSSYLYFNIQRTEKYSMVMC